MGNDDFYVKLRGELKEWVNSKSGKESKFLEYILAAPDLFHLLCKLTLDKDVPSGQKVKLGVAITYFVSPVDVVPEGIVGPAGYIDDIAMAAYVLNGLINEVDEGVVLRNWAGDKDVLGLIQQILDVADNMLGSGLWKMLKEHVGKQSK